MINGGNATIYVSNVDHAVTFYSEVLGLKLTNRFGNPIYVGDWDPDVEAEPRRQDAVGSATR